MNSEVLRNNFYCEPDADYGENNECKFKQILELCYNSVKTNKDYYLFTELYVILHKGKDYCNCKKK